MFKKILAKEFSDFRYGRIHRLTVDAYCLQHPDVYMISSKSFAAHLTGMCVAMEYGNAPRLLNALQQWLSGNVSLEKPPLPDFVGALTVFHAAGANSSDEHIRLTKEWAEDVWEAYAVYHGLAHDWIHLMGRKTI